jgi:hypothetical protein
MAARLFLGFAASVFVFHQLPALLSPPAAQAVDLITPFAVIGSAAALLISLRAAGAAVVLGLVSAILYVDGHGIHLAANSIAGQQPVGSVGRLAYFWDERFSHVELLAGWVGLVAAFALAEARRPAGRGEPVSKPVAVVTAALLGWTFFTSTVEGQTWWLLLAVAPVCVAWALRERRPIVVTAAAAYTLAGGLIGAWALLNGAVRQFSDVGLI